MNKEDIASKIMQAFTVQNSRPGHVIDRRWLQHQLVDKLNPKEQLEVDKAISDLVDRNIINVLESKGAIGWCMELTNTGYETIYPIEKEKATKEIAGAIMNQFAATNSKVGHIIMSRWITQSLIPKLNPRKTDLVNDAIVSLEKENLVTVELQNDRLDCLRLTQKGFDSIYK